MENQTAYEEARAFCDKCHRDFLRRLKQREESATGPDGQKGCAEMDMESIVQRCTETFSKKLRAVLEEAERQGAEGVKVEIKIHAVDEPLSEEGCVQHPPLRNSRGKLLERLERALGPQGLACFGMADLGAKFTVEKEAAEDAEDAEDVQDARERMEAALLEYIERLAAGETYPDEGQTHYLVGAAELLDKLLSRREGKRQ